MEEESNTRKPEMSMFLAAKMDGMKCAEHSEDLAYVATADQNGIAKAKSEMETEESELETKDLPSLRNIAAQEAYKLLKLR